MGSPGVLTEKLRRPEAGGLARARLERPLRDLGGRLGLVVAPPGSGKTTLLARVAAGATVPVAWFRVTADDGDEAALVAHLWRALQDAIGLGRPEPGAPASTTALMSDLLESLEQWVDENGHTPTGAGGLVILDDLHEIAGTPAERAVERFVLLRPHGLGVLIGSRRHPGMNIPRLQVSGALVEISSDDLRFRSWEVEELFVGVFREPLSPESAAALTRRTGGWAAGLQLFHLATTGRSVADRHRAVADLGGRSKLVRSYLARNVLNDLPEDRRQFLLRTCTLGSMTGPLCDALLETSGSAAILDELEQRQLFTSSEDDGATFRYHEVLRTHLEWALIAEYGADGARRWYARSAVLLEEIGDRRGAVRAFARAEDWGSVARLIQAGSTGGAGPAELGGMDAADVLLPAAIVQQDPWLSLAQARRRVREGSLRAAVGAFRQAEDLLDEPEFRDSCRAERAAAQLWAEPAAAGPSGLAAPRQTAGWATLPSNPLRHWSGSLRDRLRRPAAEPAPDRGAADDGPGERLAAAVAALLIGDVRGARDDLHLVEADDRCDPVQRLLAQTAGTIADLLARGHDPSGALSRIALDAEILGLPWVARLARGLEDAVLVASGGPGWRLRTCTDRILECARTGDDWGAALLTFAAAIAIEVAQRVPPAGGADTAVAAGVVGTDGPEPSSGPVPSFADAAARFRRLDAPVLAAWCTALDAALRPTAPQAAELAAQAVSAARALQVPVAEDVARFAVALIGPRGGAARGLNGSTGDAATGQGQGRHPAVSSALALATLGGVPALSGLLVGPHSDGAGSLLAPPTEPFRPAVDRPAERLGPPADRRPGTTPSALRVRCFSGFAIQIDGAPVDLASLRPRARSLLRMLAMSPGRDMHREVLVDALWPGADVAVGTRRLQVAVSSCRHLLDECGLAGIDIIGRHGDAYRLHLPADGTSDVVDFETALRDAARAGAAGDADAADAAREAALAVYTGELLPEEGPADHVAPERDRYRRAAADAAAALAADRYARRRLPAAVAAARRSVQLDRYQDAAWRTLADAHEAAGDATAAERTRREHAQVQAELDIVGG